MIRADPLRAGEAADVAAGQVTGQLVQDTPDFLFLSKYCDLKCDFG